MEANVIHIDTIGEMLLLNDLPDKHLECIVETMRKISLNEKDFTRIIIEIISDLSESTEAEQDDSTNQSEVKILNGLVFYFKQIVCACQRALSNHPLGNLTLGRRR